jgi:predicted RNA polymerase sigma factor
VLKRLGRNRDLFIALVNIAKVVRCAGARTSYKKETPDQEVVDERVPFYPAAFGELELRRRNHEDARQCFQTIFALARNPAERRFLEKWIRACD